MAGITLAVGTAKGLFLFESAAAGGPFKLSGHHLEGWEVSSILLRPRDGTIDLLAGTVHYAYGAVLRRSCDGGRAWTQPGARPAYPEGSPYKTNRIWQLCAPDPADPNLIYAGIDEAALFVTRDDGESWRLVDSLTNHPSRAGWMPGGGGLCLHTIIPDHANRDRMWVGVSAAGVFKTTDGGKSWDHANNGLASVPTGTDEPSTAYCIHKIVQHSAKPDTLFMQFHGGVYISEDGAKSWQRRESGLPSNFGFPMVMTRDHTLVIAPLESDGTRYFADGRFSVYRSQDEGRSWSRATAGLPDTPTFTGVLRDAMCTDGDNGVYLGTMSGQVVASADAGASWQTVEASLPRILCVRAIRQ